MKKIIFSLFLLSGFLMSCDNDLYSCDPFADAWVKDNINQIKVMTRDSWLKLDENESVKRAAYAAFSPQNKKKFWEQKIVEVINEFSWTKVEKNHLILLFNYVNKTDIFDRSDIPEEFEIFFYKWNDYAVNELGWSRKLIYGIVADGGKLLDKVGNTDSILLDQLGQNRIKTDSENDGESNCSCSQVSDWCDIFGEIPVVNCNSNNYKCKTVEKGCGTFWQFSCDGICKSPLI